MKQNIKLHLSYDGSHYYGWQKNSDGPSIEESLEQALVKILQHPITLQAASRTDAGVHAEDQVVNFYTEKYPLNLSRLHTSLNQILPKDIKVNTLSVIHDSFHPTLDSLAKEYHYHITMHPWLSPFKRYFFWHFPKKLDLEKMKQAAELLIGKHDFKAFTNFRKPPHQDTVREIFSIDFIQDKEDLCIQIKGDNFLYKMVRTIVGTLCYIGCHKIALQEVPDILLGRKRTNAGVTAPASGLVLKKIYYN
jgi:tRNA pseudouridine38-40 synthase